MSNAGLLLSLAKDVPKVDEPFPIVCFILNIVFPGFGTILCGIVGGMHMKSIIYGILQMVLASVLIGWIWSILWGYIIYKRASFPI